MKKHFFLYAGIISSTFYSCGDDDNANQPEPLEQDTVSVSLEKEGYEIILNEEFEDKSVDKLGLNTSHWLINQNGWDDSLLAIDDGVLSISGKITSDSTEYIGRNFSNKNVTKLLNKTSGVVHSEGIYANAAGYLEVKVKFPVDGEHIYPHIFLMDDNWNETTYGYAAFYHGGTYATFPASTSTASFYSDRTIFSEESAFSGKDNVDMVNEFNIYGIEWNSDGNIKYYFNNELIQSESVEWIDEESKLYFMIGMLMDKKAEVATKGIEVDYIRWYSKI